ncbi:DUF6093 family protein [Microbacterium gilvum]|uniref:Head-to-tail stopper n=1 Tax=Microbacterium gilvum TaxID=1336204 RepID=A0ABP8ZPZ6_9MICO
MASVLSVLRDGRRLAEARMTETVLVGRFVDGTDEETGNATRVLAEERYTGIGRVKYPSLTVSDTSAGLPVAEQQLTVSIPSGSPQCFEGDDVVVSASAVDGLLVGRRFRITGEPQSGQTTAHRYPVRELT